MKYFIFTLGCQQNVYDANKAEKLLKKLGLKKTSEKEANLIVVFACSVRQTAVDRIWGKLKIWSGQKPKKTIIIAGCVLPKDKEKLQNKVYSIIPTEKFSQKIRKIIGKVKSSKSLTTNPAKSPRLPAPERSDGGQVSFVPIISGCDNFCTYCAVPYTRGPERSRPIKEIINEVKSLVRVGYREITLLGQNVNSYKPSFVELLKKVIEIPGNFKIKFMTSNPQDFSLELIKLIAYCPKMSPEIHLPVQSGDDKILRKMNRKYSAKKYFKLINDLRLAISDLPAGKAGMRLSTDIIVGFPGETKKAFQNTVKLCKKVKFSKAYISQYSPRPGTPAAKFQDDIPKAEKKRRWKILDNLINKSP